MSGYACVGAILHLQPSIGGRESVLVSLLRLYSLCIGHFGPQVCVQNIELTSPFLQDYQSRDRGSGNGSGVCLDYVPGVLAIEGKKGGNAGCGRNRFVIRKFCYGQNLHPIVLLVVNITMQVLFQNAINSFSLAIRLGVESCGQVLGNAYQLA